MSNFCSINLIETDNLYLYDGPQDGQPGSDWLRLKNGRISGSTLGSAIGLSNFDTIEETVDYLTGKKEKKFTERQMSNMEAGRKYEPWIRDKYCELTGNQVAEIGFCIPKSDTRLGVSVDGLFFDNQIESNDNLIDIVNCSTGIIEIKTAQKIYRHLRDETPVNLNDSLYHELVSENYIFPTHYCQMQMGMEIFNLDRADYVVYCLEDKQLTIKRINRNRQFWNRLVMPRLEDFFDREQLSDHQPEIGLI